uniref:Respirasome Complex Assembly Factor 1 n=1 Tax=Peromyscus maniculatus bairdii TaxID=230844 RepID=A0A8C8TZM9_PERMB
CLAKTNKQKTPEPQFCIYQPLPIVGSSPQVPRTHRDSPASATWDEFLDVIYWFRQIIAVVLGVIWGILPLRGFLGIAGFCLINAGVLYLYFSNYLQIDEEEYGGTWELTKEGFMTSFALFMVCVAGGFTTVSLHFRRCWPFREHIR